MVRLAEIVLGCGCVLLLVCGALAFWGRRRYIRRCFIQHEHFSAQPLEDWEWRAEWAGWEGAVPDAYETPSGRHRRITQG